MGERGLRERRFVLGAEKLRRGRGRTGVVRVRSGAEELEEEEEMTEAFLLSSANVGVAGCVVSGDGDVTWSLSIRGGGRAGAGVWWALDAGRREENTEGEGAVYNLRPQLDVDHVPGSRPDSPPANHPIFPTAYPLAPA